MYNIVFLLNRKRDDIPQVMYEELTLEEAKAKMLALFNAASELDCKNWGAAIANSTDNIKAYPQNTDGTLRLKAWILDWLIVKTE